MEEDYSPKSNNKIRCSAYLTCCFGSSSSDESQPSIIRSSSTWLRSKAHELRRHHRRGSSTEFSYDSFNYALNFDDSDVNDDDDNAVHYRSFSSRLPASPQPQL